MKGKHMTPEQFAYWLQGFVELNGGKQPSQAQWKAIKEHLGEVFTKVTPPVGEPLLPPRVKPDKKKLDDIMRDLQRQRRHDMHYRNGREAKNGDVIVRLSGGKVERVGTLQGATPGNGHYNGEIAPLPENGTYACLCDCLHVDDVAAFLAEKGLDKR